ncbi:hypothetical protein [Amycolatopsis granulosa]|uniref:hypothetical protein n=1 Tax=Amycolatopsis granulosa TaxID=185684 RepID=UPI001422BE86|nr:hypothetical protein [Amycolatopsis granulosa]NIH87052.1 hypothetical protein [Amycolatopsis granulosa]
MKKLVLSLLVPVLAAMTMIVGGGTASAASNPYTAAGACAHDFGGSWQQASTRGRYAINSWKGHAADVYLMYNAATGYNCVVTIKRLNVGTATRTGAHLEVQGGATKGQWGDYKYYSAVQAFARDRCIRFFGSVWVNPETDSAGPSDTWGNCH